LAAEEAAGDGVSAENDDVHSVAITISPLHFFLPMAELTGEFSLSPRFGLALLAGYGSVTASRINLDGDTEDVSISAYELGGSARFYPIGDFDQGMQLGAELLYLHVSPDDDTEYSGSGAGLGLGPFIGYKFTGREGFVFDAQLGFQVLAVQAEDSSGSESSSDSGIIPLLNLNIGWAF
jgi:hypothetical protein